MQYDPIKRALGKVFNKTPFLRILFYKLLNLLLLRSWYVKKEINIWSQTKTGNANILDAGSGFGQYSYFLSSKNKAWNVIGVDVKKEQIEDCNNFFKRIKALNIFFKIVDLTKFNEENQYDLIISVDVMEHILEDVKVFENFHQSLKDGGMLLISTPSDQGGSDVHEHDHDNNNDSFIDEHVRDGYNIEEIQEKLKKAGYSKTEAYYQYGKPGQFSWRLSMKYPLQILNVSKLFFIIIPIYYLITFPISFIFNFLDVSWKQKKGTGLIVKAWK